MNIALMTNNYKPFVGGVPISVERLKRGLKRLGHEVTVFAPTYREQEAEEDCVRYASLKQNFFGGIVLPNPLDRRIEKKFAKQHFDVIHVHHPMLIGRTAVYLSRKYGIPLVFTYHTRYEQYLSYFGAVRRLEQGAERHKGRLGSLERGMVYAIKEKLMPAYLHTFLKYCDCVFAPTKGIYDYLHENLGMETDRLNILPTGIEEESYCAKKDAVMSVRRAYGAAQCPLFLSVSRMAHEKNVEFLLESLAIVRAKTREPFKVLLVGEGPDKRDYERRAEKLGLGGTVIFTGNIPNRELAPFYAAADAFLFASKTETQGIVILEAFAGGAPVYAVRASGVSDLVKDGYNGRLTEEDPGEYAGKLLDILHRREPKELAENAYASALAYSETEVARKAINLYNKVAVEKTQRTGALEWTTRDTTFWWWRTTGRSVKA